MKYQRLLSDPADRVIVWSEPAEWPMERMGRGMAGFRRTCAHRGIRPEPMIKVGFVEAKHLYILHAYGSNEERIIRLLK